MISLAKFLPREEKFYTYLEQLAALAHESARCLKIFIESAGTAEREKSAADLARCRAEAKTVSANVTRDLCTTFVTPFDREDIQNFSADLYKIVKTAEKIRERLSMHGLASERGDFSRQMDVIVQEAQAMKDMVHALVAGGKSREIQEKAAALHDLENKGDEILGELLQSLFREAREPRDFILRKDVYDMLEKIIDRYRDAAGVAIQIVLKHS